MIDTMCKRGLLAVACALLVVSTARADEPPTNAPALTGPDLWFPVGEELQYTIYWGVIPVGYTHITTAWTQHDGRTVLLIRYRTRSNKVIATLYPVDDFIESLIEPTTFLPIKFTKNLKEGRHRYHEVTTFDFENLTAHWHSYTRDHDKTYDIEPDTRDLVAFMYFMRSRRLDPGEERNFRVMADEKIYDLYVHSETYERVKLKPFGKVKSLRMEPKAKFQGLFVRKGKMKIWASRDERHLATRIDADTPFADIHVKLTGVYGPGDDFWVTRTREAEKKPKISLDDEEEEDW